MICPICKHIVDNNSNLCPYCGNQLLNTHITECRNCGAPYKGFKVCAYCGSAFPEIKPAMNTQTGTQQVIVQQQEDKSGIGTAAAAFLGGVVGGLLDW